MKKWICILAALALLAAFGCPAFAAEDTFVPSISYKDGPEIIDASMQEQTVGSCLVVTSLKAASEKTTDISQQARDLLLEVYEKISSGEMELPVDEGYVVRELVDLSWKQVACIEQEHGDAERLAQDGVTVRVRFEMGVDADDELVVLAYRDGAWEQVESVTVDEDGSVTCEFSHFCPVAFCVDARQQVPPTGDLNAQSVMLWVLLMAASAMTLVVMLVDRRRNRR